MKKLFLFAALCVAATFSACSRDDCEPLDAPDKPPLTIAFAEGDLLQFDVGETKTVHYTITSSSNKIVVKAVMQTSDGAYTLSTTSTSATKGTITITAKTPETENCVVVTVSDGSQTITAEIAVSTNPNLQELAIAFAEGNSLQFNVNETKTVHYTITGGEANTVVNVKMQKSDGAYTLSTTSTSATKGTITITAKMPDADNRVIVTISGGDRWVTAEIAISTKPITTITIMVETPGALEQLLAGYDKTKITELTVIGNLNSSDIWTLRELPNLAILDMEHVNLEELPSYAFCKNTSLKNTSLTSVKLPLTLKTIGNSAFYNCTSLTSITIPNSVTEIGGYAFDSCSSLTSVTIPDSVTEIGLSAFSACSSLTSIIIPNSVTTIGNNAFLGCSSLKGVYITDIVKWCAIEFYWGTSNPLVYAHNLYLNGELVTELVIPDSVTSIGNYAFYSCSSLTSVTIGNGVTSIGKRAFYYCSGLTSITIPNSVTTIGDSAFWGCSSLTSITIPDSVTSIGDWAFYECSGLTNVAIPNSVVSIGNNVFSGCSSLTSVTIGNSVTTIGKSAFSNCSSLTSVTIGNSVTTIGNWAFSSCSGLTSIYCKAQTPPGVVLEAFQGVSTRATLYVPIGRKAAYAAATGWKKFTTIKETQF